MTGCSVAAMHADSLLPVGDMRAYAVLMQLCQNADMQPHFDYTVLSVARTQEHAYSSTSIRQHHEHRSGESVVVQSLSSH